jgi:hypothetical protein
MLPSACNDLDNLQFKRCSLLRALGSHHAEATALCGKVQHCTTHRPHTVMWYHLDIIGGVSLLLRVLAPLSICCGLQEATCWRRSGRSWHTCCALGADCCRHPPVMSDDAPQPCCSFMLRHSLREVSGYGSWSVQWPLFQGRARAWHASVGPRAAYNGYPAEAMFTDHRTAASGAPWSPNGHAPQYLLLVCSRLTGSQHELRSSRSQLMPRWPLLESVSAQQCHQ